MKVAGIPFDQGAGAHGVITPTAGVLHRTYGGWGGDYSVGKNAPGGVSFHFLVGKLPGQVVQFHDTTTKCWHAGGWPNSRGVGIEFTGKNEDPLTDWQVEQGGKIIRAVSAAHGIPLDYYHGPRVSSWAGWLTHASVAGSDHTDMVTQADWLRMVKQSAPPPAPTPLPPTASQEDDMCFLRCEGLGLFLLVGGKAAKFATPQEWNAARDSAPTVPTVTVPKSVGEQLV